MVRKSFLPAHHPLKNVYHCALWLVELFAGAAMGPHTVKVHAGWSTLG